jgi:hypothetical protein
MNRRKLAAAVLSTLLYAQGLLGFAGLATVLMKEHAHAATAPVSAASAPAALPAAAH